MEYAEDAESRGEIRMERKMTCITLEFPDSLIRGIQELAAKDGYSVEQFLISAAGEKLSRLWRRIIWIRGRRGLMSWSLVV
ncbi:hypothetical protein [Prosthecobacter sp.]|uniref:hypothetical protein n=1 Tax=Prosthecobacter sp. TaxID=1965333 RepID=UPI0037839982